MKGFSVIGVIYFAMLTVAQLLRLIFQVEVLIDGDPVPMWTSVPALILTGALAIGIWTEVRDE